MLSTKQAGALATIWSARASRASGPSTSYLDEDYTSTARPQPLLSRLAVRSSTSPVRGLPRRASILNFVAIAAAPALALGLVAPQQLAVARVVTTHAHESALPAPLWAEPPARSAQLCTFPRSKPLGFAEGETLWIGLRACVRACVRRLNMLAPGHANYALQCHECSSIAGRARLISLIARLSSRGPRRCARRDPPAML